MLPLQRKVTNTYIKLDFKERKVKMVKREKMMFPLNLQFFAEDDDNSGNENNGNDNGDESNKDQNDNSGEKKEKTFTQSQVSAMMTKEKNEGKRSILNSLGFKTEDEAKKAINLYNALVNSQKTEEEKSKEDVNKANDDKNQALSRAEAAENKLTCFEAGVDKDSIDDVLAIARTKVSDSKTLSDVLDDMKKETRYASFFKSTNSGSGTGSNPKHTGGSGSENPGDYGKQLALGNSTAKKDTGSKYF